MTEIETETENEGERGRARRCREVISINKTTSIQRIETHSHSQAHIYAYYKNISLYICPHVAIH